MTWRLVLGAGDALEPLAGAENMAIDAALLESVRRGAPPVLRFYLWRPACLSFGRNQPARDRYDPDRLYEAGIQAVRRPTGGLAVLHDAELTYSIVASTDLIGRPRTAYHRINQWLVMALRQVGALAEVFEPTPAPSPVAGPTAVGVRPEGANAGGARSSAAMLVGTQRAAPCFDVPAPGEVVAAGRKLIGSAQRCEGRTLLQHGSILLDGDQRSVRRFERGAERSGGAAPAARSGAVTLRELTGRPVSSGEIVAAFLETCGIALAPAALERDERARAGELTHLYASDGWTWRR